MVKKEWNLCKLNSLVFIIICFFNIVVSSSISDDNIYHLKSGYENNSSNNTVNDDEYQCILESPDPWDPTIPSKFFKANLSACESKYRDLSSLTNGYVKIDLSLAKPNSTCQWQCLFPDDIKVTYTKSEWHEITDQSKCDVIKVRCFINDNSDEQYYENLHVQVSNSYN
uniref:Uncharacterized protein n=1 Tax=Panagrolaimus sp. ES5 TaxID=591445 RepID=A0AC34GRD4_9BILA